MTLALFALHPLALGAWLAHIPMVQSALGLDKAELAIALLGLPVATIPTLQIASRVIARFGPRRIMAVAFPFQAVVVVLPLLATSQLTLFLALMCFGVAMAFLQVCLNVHAGRLEKTMGVSVMNRCHGFWALGLMFGPVLVAGLSVLSPVYIVGGIAGVSGVLAAGAALRLPRLGGVAAGVTPPRRSLRQIPPALAAISICAFAAAITEGAMADWAAVYLAERLPEGSRIVGLGVSLYAATLALGRLTGDWLKDRFGAVVLARGTYAIGIAGLICLGLPAPLGFAFLGFALVGAGVSVGFPLGVSAAAALDDRYEGANIAIMSATAICGFLIGPPVIGFLAETYTLSLALMVLIPVLMLGIALAWVLRPDADAIHSPDSV